MSSRRRRLRLVALVALAGSAALAGCQADGSAGAPSTPAPDGRVAAAIADLAGRIGVETALVQAGDLEAVTWPDGSLGCPRPGMMYTQALVDGVRVILEAGGARYAYHGAETGPLVYCVAPTEPVP